MTFNYETDVARIVDKVSNGPCGFYLGHVKKSNVM